MARDVGRGIIAPDNSDNIGTGASEMRTLGVTTAAAITNVDVRVSGELAQKLGKTEAYRDLVPRDEAAQYGIEGPRGPEGPPSEVPGPQGPGGSIALEETDPGCFVDSEITWMQWPQSGGLPAVWNPNTEAYENPIRVDTSVGTRVYVGDTMIYGDTGMRTLTDRLGEGVVPSISPNSNREPFVRRVNDTIYMSIYVDIHPAGITSIIPSFPFGFRPSETISRAGQMHYAEGVGHGLPSNPQNFYLSRNSGVRLAGNTQAEKTVLYTGVWLTNDPWPTSLPGTPA